MGTKKGYSLSYDLRNSIWIVLCAGVFLLSSGTNSNLTLCVSCNFLGVSRSIGKRNLSKCRHNLALTTEENLTNTDFTISVKDEWLFKFMTISLFSPVKSTIVKNNKPFYYASNGLTTNYQNRITTLSWFQM